ncbi:MAG TPA: hypothetical protein VHO72_12855 [Bacteroidales bacterium]|nr:hypothetical protein [Bacteroidales bacterium]
MHLKNNPFFHSKGTVSAWEIPGNNFPEETAAWKIPGNNFPEETATWQILGNNFIKEQYPAKF